MRNQRAKRTAQSWTDLTSEENNPGATSPTCSVQLDASVAFLDRDFVLEINTESCGTSPSPQAWIEEHPDIESHKALMLTIPAGFASQPEIVPGRSEIIFLTDRSGSMEDKMEALRSAMQYFLKGIPQGKKFNIWCFGSSYTHWSPQSVDYSEASLQSADVCYKHLQSRYGWYRAAPCFTGSGSWQRRLYTHRYHCPHRRRGLAARPDASVRERQ